MPMNPVECRIGLCHKALQFDRRLYSRGSWAIAPSSQDIVASWASSKAIIVLRQLWPGDLDALGHGAVTRPYTR